MVICPVQFYDRWNLPRLLLDHTEQRSEKELQLAHVFVDFLENNIQAWLSDMYMETMSRTTGTYMNRFMEETFTQGMKRTCSGLVQSAV